MQLYRRLADSFMGYIQIFYAKLSVARLSKWAPALGGVGGGGGGGIRISKISLNNFVVVELFKSILKIIFSSENIHPSFRGLNVFFLICHKVDLLKGILSLL